jgi:hypothetical protein
MSKKIFEEKGGPHRGHAAGDTDLEKQASQLASDVKYKVKKGMGEKTNLNPAQVAKAYLAQLAKSPAPPAVKALAKKKILGEEYVIVDDIVETSVANALFKVFVEGVKIEEEVIEEEDGADKKYFVRVTDKKTGNTYRRWATRAKITELRGNPNISSVEMTEYGEADQDEKAKGEKTAKVKSGKGLDPVGKEDTDVDNDGKHNDPNDKYIMKRRAAVGSAIAKRKGVAEEFVAEVTKEPKETKENAKIDVMKGKNDIDVFPELKIEEELSFVTEKAVSKAQQRFMGMVYDAKKGGKPASPEVEKAASGMSKKEAKKFAKTKHKGLPQHVTAEEKECGSGDKGDPRQASTKSNLVRNKLRAMGLKMDYTPEGEQIDEIAPLVGAGLMAGAAALGGLAIKKAHDAANSGKKAAQTGKAKPSGGISGAAYNMQRRNDQLKSLMNQSYEPEGEMTEAWSSGRGRRGPDRNAVGGADRNGGRNRYLGSPTPEQEADEKKRGDEAAKRAVAQLRRRRAAEEAKKNKG